MKRFYHAASGGFFDEIVHGPLLIERPQTKREKASGKRPELVPNPDCKIPEDAVQISQSQYQALLAAQGAGQKIVARGGKPVAIDRGATPEELEESRRLERGRRLASCDWTELPSNVARFGPDLAAEWAAYRQALRDIDMAGTDWPTPPMEAR